MSDIDDLKHLSEFAETEDFTIRFREIGMLIGIALRESAHLPEDLDELYAEYCEHESAFGQSPLSDRGRIEFVKAYFELGSVTDAEAVHADIADPVSRISSNTLFLERRIRSLDEVLRSGERDALTADINPVTESETWHSLGIVAEAWGERAAARRYFELADRARTRITTAVAEALPEPWLPPPPFRGH